jgi:probable F420-dependent oxidoreductase
MKLGFALPMAGAWATPENVTRVARTAEALGYDSLWVFQRLLYALEPRNDYPPLPGQPWPAAFQSVLDPIATLTFAAAVTERIRLGTSVLIMPFYQPAVLAKQLATLDVLSRGRLEVGLGLGWSEDEYCAVGVPFHRRGHRADEFLRCLKAVWTDEVVEFEGEFYRVPRCRIEPKPVQKPHPPITIGGYSPVVIRRAVELGDGFSGGNVPLGRVAPIVDELHQAARAAGRDPAKLHVVSRGSYQVYETAQGADRRPLWGTVEEIREDIERYAGAGLTLLFLEPNFQPRGPDVERVLAEMEVFAPRARSARLLSRGRPSTTS